MTELRLDGVTKRFKSHTVLEDVGLTVRSGETVVLFGPSGAGKTVLLRIVAGAIEPDGGRVAIGGVDMAGVAPEHRGIGMAFQNFALFPHMTAEENIAAPLHARRDLRGGAAARVREVARLLKIDHVLGQRPRELSNGQKQRTALGRALAAEPTLLLLDDPLRNVDAKLRFEMRLELPRLLAEQGATVVYVTQDFREAMALGDRIAVLDGGRVLQIGTPEEVYLRPASVAVARLFGDPTINLVEPPADGAGDGQPLQRTYETFRAAAGIAPGSDRDVVVGVRPEALRLVSMRDRPVPPGELAATRRPTVAVTVEAETPLNEKIVTLAVTGDGRELLVSRPSGVPLPDAHDVGVEIDPAAVLVFDRATGARIPAPAETNVVAEAAQ